MRAVAKLAKSIKRYGIFHNNYGDEYGKQHEITTRRIRVRVIVVTIYEQLIVEKTQFVKKISATFTDVLAYL